jgi:hypothetical protein
MSASAGSVMAFGAGAIGLVISSPLVPAGIVAGSVVGMVGWAVSYFSDGEAEKKLVLSEYISIIRGLEVELANVKRVVENQVIKKGGDVEEVNWWRWLIDQLAEDKQALPGKPPLKGLERMLENLLPDQV